MSSSNFDAFLHISIGLRSVLETCLLYCLGTEEAEEFKHFLVCFDVVR